MQCINKSRKDFKDLANHYGVSADKLAQITYKYWEETGSEEFFPTSIYIQNELGKVPYTESIPGAAKLWDKEYRTDKTYDTAEQANAAREAASKFFPSEAITIYENSDGKYTLSVRKPITDVNDFLIKSLSSKKLNTQEQDDYILVINKLQNEAEGNTRLVNRLQETKRKILNDYEFSQSNDPLISYISAEPASVIKGELGVNKEQLISLLGSTMYKADIQSVAVKELLQNAFDAVKIAKVSNPDLKGNIDIKLDSKERTVTIKDNGTGMTPEIVQKAFFTIGGSYKGENVDNRLKSGGLGLAKMAFLFSSDYVEVSTVKDGTKTYVKATPEQIQSDNFQLVTSKVNEPNGTTVTVKIPEYYIDENGEKRTIWFNSSPSFLDKPMLGNVTVNVTRKNSWGDETTTSSDKNQMPKGYTAIGKAKSAFGDLEIYLVPITEDTDYVRSEILISGLHQFQHYTEVPDNGRAKFRTIINILPSVGVTSNIYPINNQREDFRKTIDPEIKDLNFLLLKINNVLEKRSIENAFKNTMSMDVRDVSDVKRQESTKNVLDKAILEARKEIFNQNVEEDNASPMENSLNLSDIRSEREQKEKERRSSLDTSGIKLNDSEDSKISKVNINNLDVNKPLFHNNTDIKIGEDGQKVLNELGSLLMELKSLYLQTYEGKNLKSWNGENLTDYIKKQYWGFSFDKEYGGVNVAPQVINLLAINPFYYETQSYDGVDTALSIVGTLIHLIMHEFNHNYIRSEDANFTGRFPVTHAEFVGIGKEFNKDWMNKLYKVVENNLNTFIKYENEFKKASNLGESFEANRISRDGQSGTLGTEENGSNIQGNRSGENVSGYGEEFRRVYEGPAREETQFNTEGREGNVKPRTFTFKDGTTVKAPFRLNSQQELALNEISDFIDSDETSMTLSGYAGTGKTSLMEMIAEKMKKQYRNIMFSASTNKAAAVLRSKVRKSGFTAATLNKIFGIQVTPDESTSYDAANLVTKIIESKIRPGTVVVIDEASMINEKNYNILNDVAEEKGLKIIYVGDAAQLAPVNESKISKVFRDNSRRKVELTKVERTDDNAILKEATNIREGKPLSGESSFNKEGKGVAYIKPSSTNKIKDIIEKFVPALRKDADFFRILAYTNNKIAKYNEAVRTALGYMDNTPRVGEPIVGYHNWGYVSGSKNEATYKFVNSESYKVVDVSKPTVVTKTLEGGRKIPMQTTIIEIEDALGNRQEIMAMDIKGNPQNLANATILAKEKARLWDMANSTKGETAKAYRSAANDIDRFLFVNDSIEDESRIVKRNGVEVHPLLQNKVYDFGYAMTVHKSQGSTFTHVLIDDENISSVTAVQNPQRSYDSTINGMDVNLGIEDNAANQVEVPAEMSDVDTSTFKKTSEGDIFASLSQYENPAEAPITADMVQDDNSNNIRQQLEYVAVSRATDTVSIISNAVKSEDTPLNHLPKDVAAQVPEVEQEKPAAKMSSSEVWSKAAEIAEPMGERPITYTPQGKDKQNYIVKEGRIYNKNGEEEFPGENRDKNKVLANLAIKEDRAVLVDYKDRKYVVDNLQNIISVSAKENGNIMKWGEENGDRKAILKLAEEKFRNLIDLKQQRLSTVVPQMMDLLKANAEIHGLEDMKKYLAEHPEASENDDIQMLIGKKARTQFEQQLRKARPDMSDAEIKATLDFLHSLEDNKENTAYIKTAVRWIANRSITLPMDNTKAKQAFDLARKKNIDIQKYKTIGELITAPEMQPKKKDKIPFNPDEAKTFSNKRTVTTEGGRVFTVYNVEDTEEGQREVCKALAAHYEISPWCLSTFTATGEPTKSAKGAWIDYNGIPKKIAFEDGRPVAFSAALSILPFANENSQLYSLEGLSLYKDPLGNFDVSSYKIEDEGKLQELITREILTRGPLGNYRVTDKGKAFISNEQPEEAKQPEEAWWDIENVRPQNTLSDDIVSDPGAATFIDVETLEALNALEAGELDRRRADAERERIFYNNLPDNLDEYTERTNFMYNEVLGELPFLKNSKGDIYGFVTPEGKMYFDENNISPNVQIHEYTHLWDRAVSTRNPELWKRGVHLMKRTSLWSEILKDENYGKKWADKGLSEETMEFLIASEVHSRLAGTQGEALLNRIAKEQGSDRIVNKLKQWILDFWKELKGTFSSWSQEELDNLTLDDFLKMTVRDLADAIPLENNISKQLNSNSEVTFTESTGGYPQRTRENITWSDVTLSFAVDDTTPGEKLTEKEASKQGKYIYELLPLSLKHSDIPRLVRNQVIGMQNDQSYGHKGKVLPLKNIKLNIAGNGIYTLLPKDISQEQINDFVTEYIKEMQTQGITISEIRSGGQTGVDEAGIIAAQRLGIPASIHAPKGYTFRSANGQDISNKEAFTSRFNQNKSTQNNTLVIAPAIAADKKATAKGSISNKFIGFADDIQGSSTANYAQQAGDKANVGNYNSADVVFVSVPGMRGDAKIRHREQQKTIDEALKALKQGATLVTDNIAYTNSSAYNEGEKKLAEALSDAGAEYSDMVVNGETVGIWKTPQQKDNHHTPEQSGQNAKAISTASNPIQIYSDGSDFKGTGAIGYGSVFEYNGKQYGLSGTEAGEEVQRLKAQFPDAKFSNPTMEMLALAATLEHFAELGIGEHIEVNQDYKGAVNYNGLWDHSEGSDQRETKAWKAKEPYIKHLVDRAEAAIKKIEDNGGSVKIRWVKGHAGDRMNDAADSYAKNRDNFNTINDAYGMAQQQSSSRPVTVTDVYNRLKQQYTPNSSESKLLELVYNALNNSNVKIVEKDLGEGVSGKFSASENTVFYNPNALQANTLLHELIHAATSYYLRSNNPENFPQEIRVAIAEIEECYDLLKQDFIETHFYENGKLKEGINVEKAFSFWIEGNDTYGYTSPAEMVAELGKESFVEHIKDFDKRHKGKNIFQRLIDNIAKLFGINKTYGNLESTLKKALTTLLTNPSKELMDRYSQESIRIKENIHKFNESTHIIVQNHKAINELTKKLPESDASYADTELEVEEASIPYSFSVTNNGKVDRMRDLRKGTILTYNGQLFMTLNGTPNLKNGIAVLPVRVYSAKALSVNDFSIKKDANGIDYVENLIQQPTQQQTNNQQPINSLNKEINDATQKHEGDWTRQEAESNPRTLYIFTDNTDRDSGSGVIPADSWYSKKYGEGHHYPTMTAAVVRGLENSRPISTQRWFHQGAKGAAGNWTDANVEEFKQVIKEELEEIVKEFNTGKYDTIMFPDGDGLFNTRISNITKERTPQLYKALADLLHEYGFDSLIPADAKSLDSSQQITSAQIEGLSGNTAQYGVQIDSNLIRNYTKWHSENPTGIVAYRVNKNAFNTPAMAENGYIGNPFNWQKYGEGIANKMFYDWLTTGNNFGEPLANEEYRQAIINKIMSSPVDTPILYYKEKNAPSHATTIGYLINNKQLLPQSNTQQNNVYDINSLVGREIYVGTQDKDGFHADELYGEILGIGEDSAGYMLHVELEGREYRIGLTPDLELRNKNSRFHEILIMEGEDIENWPSLADASKIEVSQPQQEAQPEVKEKPAEAPEVSVSDVLKNKKVKTTSVYLPNYQKFEVDPSKPIIVDADWKIPVLRDMDEQLTSLDDTSEEAVRIYAEMDRVLESRTREEYYQEPSKEQKRKAKEIIDYIRKNRQLNSLLDNEIGLSRTEIKETAEDIVNSISDIVTELQQNPEKVKEYFPDLNTEGDFSKMTRKEIITTVSINNLIDQAKKRFEDLLDDERYDDLNLIKQAELILNNWETVVELAAYALVANEKISIAKNNTDGRYETVDKDFDIEDYEASLDDNDIDGFREENDEQMHWQVVTRTIDALSSMTELVRMAIHDCYLLNKDGSKVLSKFGVPKRVNKEKATNQIISWTQGALNLSQMVDKLRLKSKTHNWLDQLIPRLEDTSGKESDLQSQFYSVMHRPFQLYDIGQMDKGTYVTKTLNSHMVLSDVMRALEAKFHMHQLPLFTIRGINMDALNELQSLYEDLINLMKPYKFTSVAGELSFSKELSEEDTKNAAEILTAISNMFGYTIAEDDVLNAITENSLYEMSEGTRFIINALNRQSKLDFSEYDPFEFGKSNSIDNAMQKFLTPLVEELQDEGVNAFFEDGKMYQSNVIPSFLTELFTNFAQEGDNFYNWLEDFYGFSEWFKKGGEWRVPWLNTLADKSSIGKRARDIFDHKVQLTFNKHSYMRNMSPEEYGISVLTEYFSLKTDIKGDVKRAPAWFRVPIQSNKPSSEFIKFFADRSKEYKENITDDMVKYFYPQELDRIDLVRKRNKKEDSIYHIDSFDENGKYFQILTFLNGYLEENGKLVDETGGKLFRNEDGTVDTEKNKKLRSLLNLKLNAEKDLTSEQDADLLNLVKEATRIHMDDSIQKIMDEWEEAGLLEAAKKIQNINDYGRSIKENIENFLWNDFFATNNILQLTIVDKSFYESSIELQKRLAELHAPGARGNKNVVDYKGRPVSDGFYRTFLLDDYKGFISNIIENLTIVFDKAIASAKPEDRAGWEALKDDLVRRPGTLGKDDKGGRYWNINATDAQAFSSLRSYRKKAFIFGKWSPEAEEAFERIINGNGTLSDIKVAFQPLKPFVYGHVKKNVGVDFTGTDGKAVKTSIQNMAVPFQAKNAEYLLFMAGAIIGNQDTGKPNILRAISRVMEESEIEHPTQGIDTVQFKSAIKSGGQAVINLNQFLSDPNGEEKAYAYMKSLIYSTEKSEDNTDYNYDSFVYKTSYDNYALQQEVPEHFRDHSQAEPSQMRANIPADLDYYLPNGEVNRYTWKDDYGNSHDKDAKEIKKEWENTHAEKIEKSFEELSDHLKLAGTKAERNLALSKILQEEVLSSTRYSTELAQACQVDPRTGEFRIPKGDPVQAKRIEQMLNSIVKRIINKQPIPGGPIVQVSSWGLSSTLNIRYNSKQGGLLMTKEEFEASGMSGTYRQYAKENQAGIAYWEVLAPASTKQLFEKFKNPDGTINLEAVENCSPELLKMITGRIPNEDKYSIAHAKIIGFLPPIAGEAVMFPLEITEVDDSDFDVDKRYCQVKTIYIVNDWAKIKKGLTNKVLSSLANFRKNNLEGYKKWAAKEKMGQSDKDYVFELVDKFTSNPEEFSNTEDSLMKSMYAEYKRMLAEDFPYKVRFPEEGTVEALDNKIIDMSWAILSNEMTAAKMLNPGGFEIPKHGAYVIAAYKAREGRVSFEDLSKKSTKELQKIVNTKRDLAWFNVQMQFYKQNAAGSNLIGVFAVNKTAHAILENDGLRIDIKKYCGELPFEIAGFPFGGLMPIDETLNTKGNYIGKEIGQGVGASADTAKDPWLDSININMSTAGMFIAAQRMRMPWNDVALFMAQDAVVKLLKEVNRRRLVEKGVTLDGVLADKIAKLRMKNGFSEGSESIINKQPLEREELIEGLLDSRNLPEYAKERREMIDFKVLLNFQRLRGLAKGIKRPTAITRLNSISSAVGPLIIDNIIKEHVLTDFMKKNNRQGTGFYIIGQDGKPKEADTDTILDMHPILKQFSRTLDSRYSDCPTTILFSDMPAGNRFFKEDILGALPSYIGDKIYDDRALLNKLSDFYQSYLVIASGFINPETLPRYIKEFPELFTSRKYDEKYPDNAFIQAIKPEYDKKLKRAYLNVDTTGMKEEEKDRLRAAWTDLHKVDPALSMMLLNYGFFRGGMGFSPKTWMSLIPIYVKENAKVNRNGKEISYLDAYRKFPTDKIVPLTLISQFIRNNWDNNTLAPMMGGEGTNYNIDLERGSCIVYNENEINQLKGIRAMRTKEGDETILWMLEGSERDNEHSRTYKRVLPLGNNGEYIEMSTNPDIKPMEVTVSTRDYTESEEFSPTSDMEQDASQTSTPNTATQSLAEQARELGELVPYAMQAFSVNEKIANQLLEDWRGRVLNGTVTENTKSMIHQMYKEAGSKVNKEEALKMFETLC